MLNIAAATGSGPSATVLRTLLASKGIPLGTGPGVRATVSWGLPGLQGPNILNARRPMDKLTELTTLKAGGVPCPEIRVGALSDADLALSPVWYGRKSAHRGGTDIAVVTQVDESGWRVSAGWTYFTSRIPIKRELRVWMFRGRQLGTYEKRMVRPEQFVRAGRNHDNGFSFDRVRGGVPGATEVADAALTALGLDFGAADILETPDGRFVVLEVNTAPGIEHERRQCAINLADAIARWYNAIVNPIASGRPSRYSNTNEQRFGFRTPARTSP